MSKEISISIGILIGLTILFVVYNTWKNHWKGPDISLTLRFTHGSNPIPNSNRFLTYYIDYTIENQGSKAGLIKNFKLRSYTLGPTTHQLKIVIHEGIPSTLIKPNDPYFESFYVDFTPKNRKTRSLIRELESASITIELEKETHKGFEKEIKTITLF